MGQSKGAAPQCQPPPQKEIAGVPYDQGLLINHHDPPVPLSNSPEPRKKPFLLSIILDG